MSRCRGTSWPPRVTISLPLQWWSCSPKWLRCTAKHAKPTLWNMFFEFNHTCWKIERCNLGARITQCHGRCKTRWLCFQQVPMWYLYLYLYNSRYICIIYIWYPPVWSSIKLGSRGREIYQFITIKIIKFEFWPLSLIHKEIHDMFLLDISKPVCVQSKNVISTACSFVLNNLLCRFVLFSLMDSVRVLVTYVVMRPQTYVRIVRQFGENYGYPLVN